MTYIKTKNSRYGQANPEIDQFIFGFGIWNGIRYEGTFQGFGRKNGYPFANLKEESGKIRRVKRHGSTILG